MSEGYNELLGMVLGGFVNDQYVIELNISAKHRNSAGIVHGGVLFSMLDTAMARAYIETLPPESRAGATLEMKINFLRPTVSGKISAFGTLINTTRRTAYVEGAVKSEDGKLVAKASGTMIHTAKPVNE